MRFAIAVLAAASAFGQSAIVNPGFEDGQPGTVPTGWFVPKALLDAGYTAKIVDSGCRTGKCVVITGLANPPGNLPFGNLMQNAPAAPLHSKRIRVRAAIRVEGAGTRAQMWLRLDQNDGSMGGFDNMSDRPITSAEWNTYDIEMNVPASTKTVVLGIMVFGPGSAWVDDVSAESIGDYLMDKVEPPRPLTSQGLTNLTAFARLYGYVRFFHPSDQALNTDWDAFAIDGVRAIEDAPNQAELAARLTKLFTPIAPTVQVYPTGKRPAASAITGPEVIRIKNVGVGLAKFTTQYNIYSTSRVTSPSNGKTADVFEAEIVPGLRVAVPLAVYLEGKKTLPNAPMPTAPNQYERSVTDRGTRLADVIIAWNIFQHFYPYFDVVKTDWMAELPRALRSASTDATIQDFDRTVNLLVAALHDGHGNVISPARRSYLMPPVTLDWIEGQYIVTRVHKNAPAGIAAGDRVTKIDGKPIEQYAASERELISGASDGWIHRKLANRLATCNSKTMQIEFEGNKSFELTCEQPKPKDMDWYTEPRPEKITEVEPGYWYVDLDRVNDADFKTITPKLAEAKGIVFDMRGYPSGPGIRSLAHLTKDTIRCARWNVPSPSKPDRLAVEWIESGWDVPPEAPYFNAPRAFLTDGRAISYAETVMGIVENYKLGEIVGEPTAATNGNVNPFRLPGGYSISWTGMKVLKHDKSQHHGIGIRPTVPVSRTRKGVAAGQDEILLKALDVVKAKAAAK